MSRLVISRFGGESFVVTGPARITIHRIVLYGQPKVRVAVEAPESTCILRDEVPTTDPQVLAARALGLVSYKDIPPV